MQSALFVSHSSFDKPIVLQLAKGLAALGVDCWVDKAEISPGDSWRSKIEEGLKSCSHFAIVLSKNSLASGWVNAELDAAIRRNVESGYPVIIPVFLEAVEVPLFLQGFEGISLADGIETAVARFADVFEKEILQTARRSWVSQAVRSMLKGLENERISFPIAEPLVLIDHLRLLPRSGKIIRLNDFEPQVEIRSVYDHVLSLAHTADCLWPSVTHGLQKSDISNVAVCIAYHELNEVIIGDIPYLTPVDDAPDLRWVSRLHGYKRLTRFEYDDREKVTNDFVSMYLDARNREYMTTFQKINADKASNVCRFFKLLDKVDPIVAVWRYIDFYRDTLDSTVDDFLERLADFFANDNARSFALNYSEDQRVGKLFSAFFDVERAHAYFQSRGELNTIADEAGFPRGLIKHLLHGHKMVFAPRRSSRERDEHR